MIILVTGGAASGKSELAERISQKLTCGSMAYCATMQISDEESRRRVERHRLLRAGKGFDTVECPVSLPVPQEYDTALVECASNLLANVMYLQSRTGAQAADLILAEFRRLFSSMQNTVVVTNEIFSDTGEYDPFTLDYLAALGRINRETAALSDLVVESVCGIPVILKGRKEGMF